MTSSESQKPTPAQRRRRKSSSCTGDKDFGDPDKSLVDLVASDLAKLHPESPSSTLKNDTKVRDSTTDANAWFVDIDIEDNGKTSGTGDALAA